MGHIKVDADDLMMAMEDNSGLFSHYLDRETGEILLKPEDSGYFEEDDEVKNELEERLEFHEIDAELIGIRKTSNPANKQDLSE